MHSKKTEQKNPETLDIAFPMLYICIRNSI